MRALPRLILRGLRDMGLRPWSELLAVVSIGLVAFLAGALLVGTRAVDGLVRAAHGEVAFQVYWRPDADPAEVARAWAELGAWPGRTALTTFTPAQALDALAGDLAAEGSAPATPAGSSASSGPTGPTGGSAAQAAAPALAAALQGRNPLPATALATLAAPGDDTAWPDWLDATLARLRSLPGVASVHHDPLRADLSRSRLRLVRVAVPPFLAVLGLIAGFTAAGTVRLASLRRAEEIAVLRLVGASRWYVRLPHLVHGAALGALSGCLALGLLQACLSGPAWLAGLADWAGPDGAAVLARIKDVLQFAPFWIKIDPLPWPQAAALVGSLALVGAAASWTAGRE